MSPPKRTDGAKPNPNITLTFEQHAKVMRAFRAGQTPYCPRCSGDFDMSYPSGHLQAVCWNCGATVRDLPSTIRIQPL